MPPVRLLYDFPDEGKDEEREDSAPDKGVEDHDHPPDGTAARRAEGVGHDESRLAEKPLEDEEQDEVQHAKRHVGKQERFHLIFLSFVGWLSSLLDIGNFSSAAEQHARLSRQELVKHLCHPDRKKRHDYCTHCVRPPGRMRQRQAGRLEEMLEEVVQGIHGKCRRNKPHWPLTFRHEPPDTEHERRHTCNPQAIR